MAGDVRGGDADSQNPDAGNFALRLRLGSARRKREADGENDREPDHPHGGTSTEDGWRESSRRSRHAPAPRPGLHRGAGRYSMALSARTARDCGIVSPNARAVLRLMTRSNLVGCSKGSSPDLAPFRILSTWPAELRMMVLRSGP